VSDDDFLLVEASDCPMSSCAAPAGSPCRTGRGGVAAQYHTARFRLVPRLAKALSVPMPLLRKPGSAWTELPRPATVGAVPAGHVRIGYARASTVRQSLDTQTDALRTSGVTRIFAEKISTGGHPARARQGRRPRQGGVMAPGRAVPGVTSTRLEVYRTNIRITPLNLPATSPANWYCGMLS
jgi:hypothetical protein